jgi:hypothetical protein
MSVENGIGVIDAVQQQMLGATAPNGRTEMSYKQTHIWDEQPPKCNQPTLLLRRLDRCLSCVPACSDEHGILVLLAPYVAQGIVATLRWCIHINVVTDARLDDMEVSEVTVLPELVYEI